MRTSCPKRDNWCQIAATGPAASNGPNWKLGNQNARCKMPGPAQPFLDPTRLDPTRTDSKPPFGLAQLLDTPFESSFLAILSAPSTKTPSVPPSGASVALVSQVLEVRRPSLLESNRRGSQEWFPLFLPSPKICSQAYARWDRGVLFNWPREMDPV